LKFYPNGLVEYGMDWGIQLTLILFKNKVDKKLYFPLKLVYNRSEKLK